jgi:hypothetical protein
MDFARQCKRFLNYTQYSREHFHKTLANISALGVFKNVQKISGTQFSTNWRIVLADNDTNSLFVLNESDGQLIKETQVENLITYGLCCTNKNSQNFIYVSDYNHNKIRKFDENLVQIKEFSVNNPDVEELSGPCTIVLNHDLNQIQVVDQKNCRVICFDMQTESFQEEILLFQEDINREVRFFRPIRFDLSAKFLLDNEIKKIVHRIKLDFWPFGLFTKGERIYVTDWQRGNLYVYKNGSLERKIRGDNSSENFKKIMSRPRDITLDSLDSILVTDLDRNSFCFLDHKGNFLFETKVPKYKGFNENGIFGIQKIDNNRLIFASNTSIYILYLLP